MRVSNRLALAAFLLALATVAYAGGVGQVGLLGRLMSPGGDGGAPPDPFRLVTEDGDAIDTESDDYLQTEAAP